MNSLETKTNIQIPEDMVGDIMAFMERLTLERTSGMNCDEKDEKDCKYTSDDSDSESEECEVADILDHKVKRRSGKFIFLIKWKGRGNGEEWVNEEDCNCDILIAKYLRSTNVKTAYLFCRVSTKEQATSTNDSLEAQESELRAAARRLGYTRVKVFSISKSAYKNIPRTLRNIGEIAIDEDIILVWRVDRLSRNIVKSLGWIQELHERGVEFYSHNEGISYSKNKMRFCQALLDSNKEAEILGERIKLSYRRKRARGDEHVGGLAYGKKYKRILSSDGKSTVRKTVVNNTDEMRVLESILDSDATRSAEYIAKRLNRNGRYKRGKRWNAGMVRRVRRGAYNTSSRNKKTMRKKKRSK